MLIVFDSGTSVFKSFGGKLISGALGVRNTVVTMKKMSSRNATSTIGVMSMRMPTRRFGRRPESPPFFLPDFLSGVSTAPIGDHLPCGGSLGKRAGALLEVGLYVEPRGVRHLQARDHVGDDSVMRTLVHLHDDARGRVRRARAQQRRAPAGARPPRPRARVGAFPVTRPLPHLPDAARGRFPRARALQRRAQVGLQR